ncbi:hypothetical protein QBC40DRAFT_249459 [Triangularia verruculosa]|uniref:Transmembrane protein n=1 Tax=Triangularia verruculosa TaxID=2587418 RepID=A0AAN6XT80_9PEZI|nr:hypothetical protein QBC40DRAFT_249459 [Triangularia verruculosa]
MENRHGRQMMEEESPHSSPTLDGSVFSPPDMENLPPAAPTASPASETGPPPAFVPQGPETSEILAANLATFNETLRINQALRMHLCKNAPTAMEEAIIKVPTTTEEDMKKACKDILGAVELLVAKQHEDEIRTCRLQTLIEELRRREGAVQASREERRERREADFLRLMGSLLGAGYVPMLIFLFAVFWKLFV